MTMKNLKLKHDDDCAAPPAKETAESSISVDDAEEKKDGYPRINSLAGFLEDNHTSIDLNNLPEPPLEIFNDEIRKVIDETAVGKCIPPSMSLCIVLALASACINRSRGAKYRKNWKERANIFMVLVAETGSGKSHAFKYLFQSLKQIQAQMKKQYKLACRQYLEDMGAYRKSKDPNKALPKKPVNIQYLLDDSTMEAASERMEDNPKGLFWSLDEMSGFFASIDKYNKSGGDGKRRLLSAFNCEEWNTSRKSKDGETQERYIAEGAMGIFGGIQPHLLNNLFSYDDVKQGLPQRFLYTRAVIDKPLELPLPLIPDEIDRIIERMTQRMVKLEMKLDNYGDYQTEYLELSENAGKVFEHFSNLMTKRSYGTEAYGYAVKMSQITLRLAVLLTFLEWASKKDETECPKIIDYDAMTSATKLANWFCSNTEAIRQHFPTSEKSDIQKLQRVEKKKTLLEELHEFIEQNHEFCSEQRTAVEILNKMKKKTIGAVGFGRFLKDNGFEGAGRITKYELIKCRDAEM